MWHVVVAEFINNLKFTEGLSVSDIIGWALTFLAGALAFRLIDHMQTSIERHNMLTAIEDGFSNLFDMPIALHIPDDTIELTSENAANYSVVVRSVLHDDTPWEIIRDENGRIEYKILNNQRYIHIRDTIKDGKYYNEWISTQALHELTLKARRIEKMFKGNIIKRVDLADLFRELIPLGTSGRMEFFAEYYSDYDADCVGYLVMQAIVSAHLYNNPSIVKYFADYYNSHEEIHKYFTDGRRLRKFKDSHAVKGFKIVMDRLKEN